MRRENRLCTNLLRDFKEKSDNNFIKNYEISDADYNYLSSEVNWITEKHYNTAPHHKLVEYFDECFVKFFETINTKKQ